MSRLAGVNFVQSILSCALVACLLLAGCGDINQLPTVAESVCGNGVLERGEVCDGEALDTQMWDCSGFGFAGGELRCNILCNGFDTSTCWLSWCGNGVREGYEVCDGEDFGSDSCTSLGYAGGSLSCEPDCTAVVTTSCLAPECGNGIIEFGEVCDGNALNHQSCEGMGYAVGDLACAVDCQRYDVSSCSNNYCGDGTIDEGEACDGVNLDGASCDSLGLGPGTLVCGADCSFDTDRCGPVPTCECVTSIVGNGYCNGQCNNAVCGYDGGDCCAETNASCVTQSTGCNCIDPSACEVSGACPSCVASCGAMAVVMDDLICACDEQCAERGDCCYDYVTVCIGDPLENCTGVTSYIGDGWCDSSTNTIECGWDGGDCCLETCVEDIYVCGQYAPYNCVDPSTCEVAGGCPSCGDSCGAQGIELNGLSCSCDEGCQVRGDCCFDYPTTCTCIGEELTIANSYCDSQNNNAGCRWDGGDCCAETNSDCASSWSGCDCRDPESCELGGHCPSCENLCGLAVVELSDMSCGCDEECVTRGDCCFDYAFTCGDGPPPDCAWPSWFADGMCDASNNVSTCNWDGGDCCQSTCDDEEAAYTCGGYSGDSYSCLNPDACENTGGCPSCGLEAMCGTTAESNGVGCSCDEQCLQRGDCCFDYEQLCLYPDCTGSLGLIGNDTCDTVTNLRECLWDGGDCCEETNQDCVTSWAGCTCMDPGTCEVGGGCPSCVDTCDSVAVELNGQSCGCDMECGQRADCCFDYARECVPDPYADCTGTLYWISDGYCDSSNNNLDCGFDGGDCCESTCVDNTYTCGVVGYDCEDPTVCIEVPTDCE